MLPLLLPYAWLMEYRKIVRQKLLQLQFSRETSTILFTLYIRITLIEGGFGSFDAYGAGLLDKTKISHVARAPHHKIER